MISFRTKGTIPVDRLPIALNSWLPRDIVISQVAEVENDFSARFSAKSRKYKYTILNCDVPSALHGRFSWHIRGNLEVEPMMQAVEHLVGNHDFTSFSTSDKETLVRVRNLKKISVQRSGEFVTLEVESDSFLHNMVRIMVGTLSEVGQGKRESSSIREILEARDRRLAGKTAPPQGLVLMEVTY